MVEIILSMPNAEFPGKVLSKFDVVKALREFTNKDVPVQWTDSHKPTGQWILKIILPGLRIQSEILTDLRILNLQRFVVSSIFWVRIF